jgi:hypothetical protein
LQSLPWLRGKVSIPVELESEEKNVLGQKRYEGVVACYLTPDLFTFSIEDIYQSLWVLECEGTFKQGTAFWLEGVGLISCEHVLGPNTQAFKPENYLKKYPIKVVAKKSTIDLAIRHIDSSRDKELQAKTAPELEWNDRIFVAGFPNFKLGATPHVTEGRVVGFGNVSSIRRPMINAPIIFGMSGGSVLDSHSLVVGVAVTGSMRMEDSDQTENHGVIPIGALRHLL